MRIPWLSPDPASPFPPLATALRRPDGLLAAGGDLSPTRLLSAYRAAIFPWFGPGEPILWWSPDPRCVFETGAMHEPRRLRRWRRSSELVLEADRDFDAVMAACAAPRGADSGTWILPEMRAAYGHLHAAGHAHSIEVRTPDGRLVGGLYGVAIGRMFFAESMFSAETNASKLALLGLGWALAEWGWPLIDAQVRSAHLETLGARSISREVFAAAVARLVALDPGTDGFRERFGRRPVASLGPPAGDPGAARDPG
jgi:leucyl/phenylalanyl-tRNA--protein transferase